MDKNNIPNNKQHADIYLKAYKQALLDLAAKVSTQQVKSTAQVDLCVWSTIEKVELMVEGDEYEAAANADHVTENQFNG